MIAKLKKINAKQTMLYLVITLTSLSNYGNSVFTNALGTIHKVHTLRFGDFQTLPPLYSFKQKTNVIKTIDVRFCLEPLLPP